MSLDKLKKIKTSIGNLIDAYDAQGILGPISYLEEAEENVDNAIEELKEYVGGGSDD